MQLWMIPLLYGGILCGVFDGLIPLVGSYELTWSAEDFRTYLGELLRSNAAPSLCLLILLASHFILSERWKVAMSYGLSMAAAQFLGYVLWNAERQYAYFCEENHPVPSNIVLASCDRMDLLMASGKSFDEKYCCGYAMKSNTWKWGEILTASVHEFFLFYFILRCVGFLWWLSVWLTCLNSTTKTSLWEAFKKGACVRVRNAASVVDSILGGYVEENVDKVLCDRTEDIVIRIPPSPEPKTTDIKIVLSTESNTGLTKAILESAVPGNPLRTLTPDKGNDINRMSKSQVLLTNEAGVVCGMATYAKTINGPRLITLRHVLVSCTRENDVVLAVSPLTGKGMKITPLKITRETTFRVGDHEDMRVLLETPANFAARLSLTAATMKESFKEGHGVVFSPPEEPGGPMRFCSGRVGKLGKTGLLTFSGSTLPGTSGGGVFVGNQMVSTHVGSMEGMEENLSFFNIPYSGPPADEVTRAAWLLTQAVTFESAFPETRPWMLVQQLQRQADEQSYQFTDVDAEGDKVRVTKYEAMADEYAVKQTRILEKNAKTTAALALALTSNKSAWNDDDDEEDQMVLQDMHEEPDKMKAARTGRRGILKQASVLHKVRLEAVEDEEPADELEELDRQLRETQLLVEARQAEDKRRRLVEKKRQQLLLLRKQLLGDQFFPESAECEAPAQDFGSGEQPPLEATASRLVASEKDSVNLESSSEATTTSSKPGLTLEPTPSSKKKKKKGKKKPRASSTSGVPVVQLEAATPPSDADPTSTLASLTETLQDMARQIEELKQATNP